MKITDIFKIIVTILILSVEVTYGSNNNTLTLTNSDINYQKTYAVIVAISDYQYFSNNAGGDLRYTDDDARKFYQYLVSPKGGKVNPQNVALLINQDATKNKILTTLDQVFAKAGESDRVIFYFSGHGQVGYLMPSDAKDTDTAISYERMKNSFKKCKAKTKLCFIDACNANSIKSPEKKSAKNKITDKKNGAIIVMVSSLSFQNSVEDSRLQQGAFSYYLLKGLRGEADTDHDQVITISELHKYVYFNVKKYTYGKQIPHTFGQFDVNLPVAFLP